MTKICGPMLHWLCLYEVQCWFASGAGHGGVEGVEMHI